uniref:Polypyrimidine tract-binding protein homolog 1 isoform X3 n=1 Tax=Rhizophora mucronata TaxID=61149 RepID=A0A2P2L6U5_RHIMU
MLILRLQQGMHWMEEAYQSICCQIMLVPLTCAFHILLTLTLISSFSLIGAGTIQIRISQ